MSAQNEHMQEHESKRARRGFLQKLRTYFLTGLVVVGPITITLYLTWWFVTLFDQWVKPFIPEKYNPDYYLQFSLPGMGFLIVIICITILGAATANLFGRSVFAYWERLLGRMPIVRNIYKALKQIFETAFSSEGSPFREVGIIEYPRKGLYALVFVSRNVGPKFSTGNETEDMFATFLPTTPNPTSGYLLFVPKKDINIIDMSVEEAAKTIVSAGLVIPERYNHDSQSQISIEEAAKKIHKVS